MDPGCHSAQSALRGIVMLLTLMFPLACVAQLASAPSQQASVVELPTFVNLVRQQGRLSRRRNSRAGWLPRSVCRSRAVRWWRT